MKLYLKLQCAIIIFKLREGKGRGIVIPVLQSNPPVVRVHSSLLTSCSNKRNRRFEKGDTVTQPEPVYGSSAIPSHSILIFKPFKKHEDRLT